MPTPLQALGSSLEHWQELYIIAIVLAVLSTFSIIVFSFHLKHRVGGLKASNYVYALAACLSVISTLAIITRTRAIDTEKDRQLKISLGQSDAQVQQFKALAADANKEAGEANKKAEDVATANGKLRLEVAKQEIAAHKSAAELAAQMEKVNVYAQGVGLQQQSMAHQIQAAISISDGQVQILGNALKPFAGQKVDLRMTMDSTSGRIANQIGRAFAIANVSTGPGTATYAGATFQGISIVVQKVDGHPPIADVLISTFTSIGIAVHPVVEPSFPADIVTICIGPQ